MTRVGGRQQSRERRLAAILCADVSGYSRLMRQNEEGTLATLTSRRKIIDSAIEQHRGRFVNSAGDSVLAEFASVVDAVQCAIEIQTALKAESANLASDRRMEFRIGVNLGDVMVQGEQIYGDGVNVAARLESLAEPGGICVSAKVHDEVTTKLDLNWRDLGAQRVKNIPDPVRVWRIVSGVSARQPASRIPRKYWRAGAFSLASFAIIAATILLVQHVSLRPPRTHASIPPHEKLAPPVPDIPSIAVLPFANFSNDPQQEYFSDGLTEDLITDLSKVPGLFVVARNSVFTYKDKPERVQQIGRELGVRYLLEGSARKADNEVRITAQLVDAWNGYHVWANYYDRPLNNIFQVQDQIREKIVFALKVKLSPEEQKRFKLFPTSNMDAYDLLLRAGPKMLSYTRENNREARELCQQASALDPHYSAAFMCLSGTYSIDAMWGWDTTPQAVDQAFAMAQQAVVLDESSPLAHSMLGDAYKIKGRLEPAISEAQKSITLGPSCSECFGELGEHLMCADRPREALPLIEKALRLDPVDYRSDYQFDLALLHLVLGKRDQGVDEFKQVLIHQPTFTFAHGVLAVIYADEGREAEARAEAAKWLKLVSPLTVSKLREVDRDNICAGRADRKHAFDTLERLTSGLTRSGLVGDSK